MKNFYNVLGIEKNASPEQIKKAYRSLSIKCHPDRGGSKESFQELNEAYQTLSDADKKKEYDFKMNGGNNRMPNGFPNGFPNGMHNGIPPEIFQQFFNNNGMFNGRQNFTFFHNGRPVNINRNVKPAPINKTIDITIKESFNGVTKPINIERWIDHRGIKKFEKECIYLPIPRGIDNKEIIIIEGKGNVLNDNLKGDIKIFINLINDTEFKRNGLDLHLSKTITLKEALVGFNFEITHISGKKYTINNKNGKVITPTYKKIIPHMGMRRDNKHPAPMTTGCLIINFIIDFPDTLSKEIRDKLNEIL